MRDQTGKALYHYWNKLRRGRPAPERFEIEPKQIAALLPETFILECAESGGYIFRIAGTRMCEQLGRELRGADLIDFWDTEADRAALLGLLHRIGDHGLAGYARFELLASEGRRCEFELTLLPLVHDGVRINRILGAVSAVYPPWWLGSEPALRLSLKWTETVAPDDHLAPFPPPTPERAFRRMSDNVVALKPRLRLLQGGRTEPVA